MEEKINVGDEISFAHNKGKIKKGFTLGNIYEVLKVNHYEFCVMNDSMERKWFKRSTDQFKKVDTIDSSSFPELNKMGFADLLALRKFVKEEIISREDNHIWKFNLAIVQQHIDKSVAHYFGEESKS